MDPTVGAAVRGPKPVELVLDFRSFRPPTSRTRVWGFCRSKWLRHVPKPTRTFLETDELAALLHAAGEQDMPLCQVNRELPRRSDSRADRRGRLPRANSRRGRMDRQRVANIVGEPARAATERLGASGLRRCRTTTPHTPRRTYISIALIANNLDVKWVMGQVGHADSKMAMDVYAQLEPRIKRDHDASFDRLLCTARDQLATASQPSDAESFGPRMGHKPKTRQQRAPEAPASSDQLTLDLQPKT